MALINATEGRLSVEIRGPEDEPERWSERVDVVEDVDGVEVVLVLRDSEDFEVIGDMEEENEDSVELTARRRQEEFDSASRRHVEHEKQFSKRKTESWSSERLGPMSRTRVTFVELVSVMALV